MKIKKILLMGFIIALMGSCVNYLDPYPQGNYDSEQIWQYQELVQGLIGYCYDQVNSNTRNYNDNEGVYMDGATDDAVITSPTHVLRRYAQNTMTTSQDPFATYWDRDYRAIRNCNLFLKDRRGYNTKFILNTVWNDLVRKRLQGEAFALRAWFEFDLLQKFGGKGTNGVMLGFPIITDVFEATDVVNVARNTFDECVAQIIADCDSAIKYLPIAHRDYLTTAANLSYSGGKYWGRFDGISMKALKSNLYLMWASPRFNPGNIVARWDSAAFNAKKVIDFKSTVDIYTVRGASAFDPRAGVVWTNPNHGEIVMTTRYNTGNDAMERMFYPGGFQGNGQIGASQELVDAFPMANGRPITDPLSLYNPANPYAGRDPRFYSYIWHNDRPVYRNNTATAPNLMYTFQNWNNGPAGAGKDAYGVKPTNSLTNYHIKKFVFMGLNWSDATINRQPHSKFLIRYTHMLLNFAEAANKVVGPTTSLYGMSAQTALQYLRARKTDDGAAGIIATYPGTADAYLVEQATAGAAAFDALVKNERRIALCFEGTRFYDLRRWTTDADWQTVINKPVHGVTITQNADLSFSYDFSYVADQRNFPSPYNPIPYSEMLKMDKLIQNEGWSTWN
jgi:hypothetical protein